MMIRETSTKTAKFGASLKFGWTLALLATALATASMAQEPAGPESFRGMVRLNRAPVSNEVLKVKLSRPVERQLSNGMKLVILETNRTPTVSLTIQIPSSPLAIPLACRAWPKPPRP
jgi:hypothetical protein